MSKTSYQSRRGNRRLRSWGPLNKPKSRPPKNLARRRRAKRKAARAARKKARS